MQYLWQTSPGPNVWLRIMIDHTVFLFVNTWCMEDSYGAVKARSTADVFHASMWHCNGYMKRCVGS